MSTKKAEPETFDGTSSIDVDHDTRLIRWMLERTPAQRLEALQNFADGIAALGYARKISQSTTTPGGRGLRKAPKGAGHIGKGVAEYLLAPEQGGRMIPINHEIQIGENELTERYVLSRGPGGQKVNKTATTVQLRFDVDASPTLPEEVKERLHRIASRRIDKRGVLLIRARRHRSLARNRRDARERLVDLIRRAVERQKPRKMRKREPFSAKVQRISNKRQHGQKKQLRAALVEAED